MIPLLLVLLCATCAPAASQAPDTVEGLIARGRAALAGGRAAEAQVLFETAAAKDGGSLRSRAFVLRSWMDQGRINDALDAIDALDRAGAKGPTMDYLYGMGFALKSRQYMEQNVPGAIVQMSQDDAVQYLVRATAADPELARDAFLPLAEVAWYAQKLEVARPAAERAVEFAPESPDPRFMLGRIGLSQFVAAQADPTRKAEADACWEAARAAFAKAAELLGRPVEPARIDMLTRVRVDLGHTLVWKQRLEEAQKEYAAAFALKPAIVSYEQILRALGPELFLSAIEAGAKAFPADVEGAPPRTEERATLQWWLGWARFEQKQYGTADEAFAAAVRAWPAFVNSWYYCGISRYHQQDYEGAVTALRRHWDENPADLAQSIGANPELNLSILDFLVSWCSKQSRNVEAALLSEAQSAAAPEVSRYWNNAGLFWRDAGDALEESGRAEDAAEARGLFEKSYAAYSRALELEPDHPNYLNDLAVVLHYNLDRDLPRAKELYRKAVERAEALLARTDLAPDLRELYGIALRDAKNNLKKLERGEKRDKG